jgi:hypothetical protein
MPKPIISRPRLCSNAGADAPGTYGPHFRSKHWHLVGSTAEDPFHVGDHPVVLDDDVVSGRGSLGLSSPGRIEGNLGEGTFIYAGAQDPEHPHFSVWRFSIYGVRYGDHDMPGERASITTVITGPKSLDIWPAITDEAGKRLMN